MSPAPVYGYDTRLFSQAVPKLSVVTTVPPNHVRSHQVG
jgi:hypothetical protein